MNIRCNNDAYQMLLGNDNDNCVIRHYKIIRKKYNNEHIKELSQDYDNYEDNLYIANGNNVTNYTPLYFQKYNNLNELKNMIVNEEEYFYIFNRKDDFVNDYFDSKIDECLNKYEQENKLYIRYAPKKEDKIICIQNNVKEMNLQNFDVYEDNLINEDIPIYNINTIYSSPEVNLTKYKFNEKFNNE